MRNTYQLDESDYAPAAAPRRRASARSAAQARPAGRTEALRGLLRMNWRKFLIITSAALLVAIAANALFLQTARHPAPLFAGAGSPTPQQGGQQAGLTQPAIPVPSPRPAELATASTAPAVTRATAPARDIADLIEPKSRDPISKDPIAALLKGAVPAGQVPVVAASMPEASKRVVAAQKALAKLGYGVTPDGVFGAGTRQAIQRFERDRNLPQTGEVAGRTMRELAAQSGIQIN
ncbi:peptidoglycan-binding protein [Roseiarcaceae bacterium H3SJ34-1]|uniref:peptidoglycan-binding domain-containing protein n=1 Tax=Terripilifer ovatus TaxID=3032367 RepID=UPI003AB9830E|nr:peptidoglycan-binding protein [Roseiarcaceae bacterium H3SJ34-1]